MAPQTEMLVLVTGDAGFIGSTPCRQLLVERGVAVINVDKLTYAANLRSLDDIADSARNVFEHADICNRKNLDRIFEDGIERTVARYLGNRDWWQLRDRVYDGQRLGLS